MDYQSLHYHLDDQSIAHITLDDQPKRNALTRQMRLELISALDQALADKARALILSAKGPVFCAGGDISAMGQSVEASMEGLGLLHEIARKLARFPRPVVAAVQGGAYGAGFSLALLADAVVAAPEAKFAASFGKMGLAPDTGFLWSVQRRVTPQVALDLVGSARILDADAALTLGLVDQIAEDLGTAALAQVRALMATAPLSYGAAKAWLCETSGLEAHLTRERDTQHQMYLSTDHAEAVAAFRAKRSANFTGN